MDFINKKWIITTIIILCIIWLLWLLTHFLINFKLIGNNTVIINYGDKYNEKGAKASFLGKNLKVKIKDNININKEGKYVVYYKTRNMFGIAKSLKRNVIIKDDKAPKINLKGANPLELGLNEDYVEPGYKALDNKDGDITKNVKITNNIDKKNYGEYSLIYEVCDSNNNKSKKVRKVIIKDKELPNITLKGNAIEDILIGSEYKEEGYSATDNIDGDITNKVEIINNVNNRKIGSYEIIYKVKDSSNNEVIKKRTVNIVKKLLEYKDEYDKIDNQKEDGGVVINLTIKDLKVEQI